MTYKVINFRFTDQGWFAEIKHNGALLPVSIKLDEVNARDCDNFQQAYITVSCLPYGPEYGYQMDVPAAYMEAQIVDGVSSPEWWNLIEEDPF